MRELIGQDFDIDADGVPRLHRGTASDRIISTVDTEMRHGRKSSSQRFDGYKLSVAATHGPEPLIVAVHVAPAGEQDGPQAKHLIDSQPAERQPKRILGDTAYGTGPVRDEMAQRGVEVLAPVPESPTAEGRLGKQDFTIAPDATTVTCPAGHTVKVSTSNTGRRSVTFPRRVCGACPLRDQCCPGQPHRKIDLREHEELLIAARLALADVSVAEHLRRTRPRIERLLGLLAHRYGARTSRYIGTAQAACNRALADRKSVV